MCGSYREERAPESFEQREARLAQEYQTLARRKAELTERAKGKGLVRQHPQVARAHA